jgi:hypothetical protein
MNSLDEEVASSEEVETGRLKKFFKNQGITKKNIPKAILTLKGLGYLTWLGTLGLCYRFQPLQRLVKSGWSKRIYQRGIQRYPNAHAKTKVWILKKTDQLANWKYFRWVPKTMGLKKKKFSKAIAENFVFYKLAVPITLPIQLYATVNFVRSKSKD